MSSRLAVFPVAVLYLLHQDLWFWREARPLVFGFLPIGLFYHAAFTVATTGALWLLIKLAWPSHLEPRRHEDTKLQPRRHDGTKPQQARE